MDVKRLAASFVLASRANGLSDKIAREAVLTCVRAYRDHMAEFSTMRVLEVWYTRFTAEELVTNINDPDMHKLTLNRTFPDGRLLGPQFRVFKPIVLGRRARSNEVPTRMNS